ncbi:MAG: hypothetical protein ACNA8W_07500 [Bradymonadaceae bacterium]
MNSDRRRRFHLISGSGPLLVNTDVHGNGEDFFRLRDIYLDLLEADERAQWVILDDWCLSPISVRTAHRHDLFGVFARRCYGIALLRRRRPRGGASARKTWRIEQHGAQGEASETMP